jgi:hypothetical protein
MSLFRSQLWTRIVNSLGRGPFYYAARATPDRETDIANCAGWDIRETGEMKNSNANPQLEVKRITFSLCLHSYRLHSRHQKVQQILCISPKQQ